MGLFGGSKKDEGISATEIAAAGDALASRISGLSESYLNIYGSESSEAAELAKQTILANQVAASAELLEQQMVIKRNQAKIEGHRRELDRRFRVKSGFIPLTDSYYSGGN